MKVTLKFTTMQRRLAILGALGVLTLAAGWWIVTERSPQDVTPAPLAGAGAAAPTPTPAPGAGRKIKAQLFYVTDDGMRLTGVEQDVPYAEQAVDQAREVLNAQIAPTTEPLVSAVPAGTTLRALFVTPQGEAFVDLSPQVSSAHPGGSLNELLTIYTIVHALTFNLPAITAVQLLVDGKEVDTLAGHIDLRRPLSKNLELMTQN